MSPLRGGVYRALTFIRPGLLPYGAFLRLQPLVLDPTLGGNFPFRTASPIRFVSRAPAIVVAADGRNSFNRDTSSGFWQVIHNDPARRAIVRMVLDGMSSGENFDTKQENMADTFEGGSRPIGPCAGTYRNGSELAKGVLFDPLSTQPTFLCFQSRRTGWIATNPTLTPGTYQTLEFRFSSFSAGTTFEFDADTDANGVNGDAMAGMAVALELADGTVLSGVLAQNPTDPDRAESRF